MRAVLLSVIFATSALASAAQAQNADPDLTRVDSLITLGRTTEARQALARWQAARGSSTLTGDTRAHALFLTGRLSLTWPEAEAAYSSLALSYPTAPHTPVALLRLGQGLLASAAAGMEGAAVRAVGYLERLTSDYPNAPDRAAAWLWLGRALAAAQRLRPACDAFTTGTRLPAAADTRAMLRAEQTRACTGTANPQPAEIPEFAVQVGAFSTRDAAAQLVTRLAARGIESRIVTLEGGSLFRVRTGRLPSRSDAERLARSVRDAGFDAIVVDDIRSERNR